MSCDLHVEWHNDTTMILLPTLSDKSTQNRIHQYGEMCLKIHSLLRPPRIPPHIKPTCKCPKRIAIMTMYFHLHIKRDHLFIKTPITRPSPVIIIIMCHCIILTPSHSYLTWSFRPTDTLTSARTRDGRFSPILGLPTYTKGNVNERWLNIQ